MLSMNKNKEDRIGRIGDIVWMNFHYCSPEPDIKQYGFINGIYINNDMKDNITLFFVTLFDDPQNPHGINLYFDRGLYWDFLDE